MFPTGEASSQIIKVSLDGDVRRLTVDFPAGTAPAAAFAAVGKAVQQSFDLGAADELVMKYTDDEGDLCTLAELSMEDLASLAAGKPWKLQVRLAARQAAGNTIPKAASLDAGAAAPAAEVSGKPTPDAPTGPEISSQKDAAQEEETEGSDASGDAEDCAWLPPEWREASAAMVFHILPVIAKASQLEVVRSELNTAGVERRKRVVKWCCEVLEQLDLVPEAAPLRPRLSAYINGDEPEHFGDILAELLKAWASSSSPELVQYTVEMHHQGLTAIVRQTFKALRKCKGEWKGKGKGKCGEWWRNKGEWAMMKGVMKGMKGMMKGMGKGDCGKDSPEWADRAAGCFSPSGDVGGQSGWGGDCHLWDSPDPCWQGWPGKGKGKWCGKGKGKCGGKGLEEWLQHSSDFAPLWHAAQAHAHSWGGGGSPWGASPWGLPHPWQQQAACEGWGTGAWPPAAHSFGPAAWKGAALAGCLAQKGFGKGMAFGCPPWSPGTTFADGTFATEAKGPPATSAVPATTCQAADACSAVPGVSNNDISKNEVASVMTSGAPASAGLADAAAAADAAPAAVSEGGAFGGVEEEEAGMCSEVQSLLETGLVADPGVALELLRAHGGDAAHVAAMLAG